MTTMQTHSSHDHKPEKISELVKKCQTLCQGAEKAAAHLAPEHEPFLVANLGDALAHLELVLRALGQEPSGASRKEDRRNFVRKLFGAAKEPGEPDQPVAPPKFEVSHQGLQGNSATVSMAELLSFLAFGRKTGVLWIDTPGENFLLGLSEGTIHHANSDQTPEGLRLGEILVGLGFLTRRQLERFVEQTGKAGAAVSGELLVKNGMITTEELEHALALQVQQIVKRVVQTKVALFRFREGLEISLAHRVKQDVNQLLLNSARAMDEAENADLRKEIAQDGWNSWQFELSTAVSSAAKSLVDEATAKDEKKDPAGPHSAAKPPAKHEPVPEKRA